jgi:C4-dicarboxylate-specific signal transduction histidine kinase
MKIKTKVSLSLNFCILILFITVAITYKQLNEIESYRNQAQLSQSQLLKITDFRASMRKRLLANYELLINPSLEFSPTSNSLPVVEDLNLNENEAASFQNLTLSYQTLVASFQQTEAAIRNKETQKSKKLLIKSKRVFDDIFIPKITHFIELKDAINKINSQNLKANLRSLKKNLLSIAILGLIMTIILSFLISNYLRKKFHILEQGTEEIGKGNMAFRLQLIGNDELTTITKSFNHMLEKLKESHDQLLIKQEQLFLTSKMSALGEMAKGIGHELNNPLAIILATIRRVQKKLQKEGPGSQDSLEMIDDINSATLRVSKIVNGLRSLSHSGENDPLINVSISELIDDTLNLYYQRFANLSIRLGFENHLDASVSDIIECRPVEVSQVFINLLNNAFDAIEKIQEKWINIELSKSTEHLEITFTDSGSGIPKEVRDKIMDPFFTTKEIGRGTGLGLTVSKGIIQRHKGTISIDEMSAHTKFIISLPFKQ